MPLAAHQRMPTGASPPGPSKPRARERTWEHRGIDDAIDESPFASSALRYCHDIDSSDHSSSITNVLSSDARRDTMKRRPANHHHPS